MCLNSIYDLKQMNFVEIFEQTSYKNSYISHFL